LLRSCLVFCLAFLASAHAAPIGAPEKWRAESFKFPLIFATSIPYEGTEHVRFPPEWAQFAADDGFSYVFMWDIRRVPMEAARLERGLAVYFDGLMENVARGRKLEEFPIPAAVVLHPLAAPAGWSEGYAGALHTWNAFSKGEELRLNLEITHRPCPDDRMQVFFAASKARRTHAMWDKLRKVRSDTSC